MIVIAIASAWIGLGLWCDWSANRIYRRTHAESARLQREMFELARNENNRAE